MKLNYLSLLLIAPFTLTACEPQTDTSVQPTAEPTQLSTVSFGSVKTLDEFVTRHGSAEKAFEEVINNKLAIIDFYADWCGPCRNLSPILQQLAGQNNDVLIVKVNIDTYRTIAERYGIRSVPTLYFFKSGQRVSTISGFRKKQELQAEINRLKS